MIYKISKKYSKVKFFYMDTKSAFNKIIWKGDSKNKNPIKLKIKYINDDNDVPGLLLSVLRVRLLDHNHF